jgi:hypothetical protein
MLNMTCIPRGRAATSDAARLRSKSAAIMAGVIASASIAVCARAGAANPDARQIGRVGEICRTVIGLEPGDAQYEACASSLADSLPSLSRDRAVPQVQVDCLEKGLKPGLAGCTRSQPLPDPISTFRSAKFFAGRRSPAFALASRPLMAPSPTAPRTWTAGFSRPTTRRNRPAPTSRTGRRRGSTAHARPLASDRKRKPR